MVVYQGWQEIQILYDREFLYPDGISPRRLSWALGALHLGLYEEKSLTHAQ